MFKRVKASNFLSWEDLDFTFEPGVTLIEGFNHDDNTPEGSGKSAVLNALCWGLYGKIPKDASVNDVVREGAKSCKVEVELESGYTVVRSRKPNDVYIWDEQTKIKGKDAKETQDLIEEELGLSFETFCQSVYFAQNYPNKFVTASDTDKAKILSEIQELIIFDKSRKEAHRRLKLAEVDGIVEVKNLENATEKLKGLFEQLKLAEEAIGLFESSKQDKLKELEIMIQTVDSEIISYAMGAKEIDRQALQSEIQKLNELKNSLYEAKARFKNELNILEDTAKRKTLLEYEAKKKEADLIKKMHKVEEYKSPKDKKCPTCGGFLEKADPSKFEGFIAEIVEEAGRIDLEISKLKEEAATIELKSPMQLEGALNEIEKDLLEISRGQAKAESKLNNLESTEKAILAKTKEKEKLENLKAQEEARTPVELQARVEQVKTNIINQSEKIKKVEAKGLAVRTLMAQLETLKEGFREVKQQVFGGLLKELTRKSNRYLAELFEQPVNIAFTNTGEEGELSKIQVKVTIDSNERPLGLYSGGQARRIQLAVDLALSDIVAERGNNPINLRILDEYFKDLSESSMEKALTLLQSLKGTTILIEHNSMFKAIVNNTFKVELTEGISRNAS